jgi:hypothetical protein
MDLRTGPMQAITIAFFLWLAFGAWWWRYSIEGYAKASAAGQVPQKPRYILGRLAVWLAAGVITLLVAVYISNTMNAGMR